MPSLLIPLFAFTASFSIATRDFSSYPTNSVEILSVVPSLLMWHLKDKLFIISAAYHK